MIRSFFNSCVLTLALTAFALLWIDVAAGSSTGPFQMRAQVYSGVNYLALADVARFFGMSYQRRSDEVYLTSQYSRLEFRLQRREAVINGVRVHLSHAVADIRNMPLISETDFRLLLDPVLRKWSLARRQPQRIVIDPGHGGRDPGCRGKAVVEKDIVLAIAAQVAKMLRQHGFDVVMTRDGDQWRDLDERVAMARKRSADMFVSIHANSAATGSVSGIETFVMAPKGGAATYGGRVNDSARSGNSFDKDNMRLAYEVQKYLVQYSAAGDRGVKYANFLVLRDAACPAVLVEVGFLTNRAEEQRLADSGYRHRVAQGIVQGVLAYREAVRP